MSPSDLLVGPQHHDNTELRNCLHLLKQHPAPLAHLSDPLQMPEHIDERLEPVLIENQAGQAAELLFHLTAVPNRLGK